MAECRDSDLTAKEQDSNVNANVPGWTNEQDSDSHQKRSRIIRELIDYRSLNQLRTIVGSGWDVNEELYWVEMPAIHYAARQGWTDGVKMLLDAQAKTTTLEKYGNPLSLALQYEVYSNDLINLLLEHGVDPNDYDLLNAIENGNCNENARITVQQLLEHGANPNVTYQVNVGGCGPAVYTPCTALHDAASLGWTEGVKMLLDAGAKYKRTAGLNPLAKAVHNYDCPPDLIELLLKHGVDPNDHDGESENIPLVAAIKNLSQHDTNIVKLLLDHGADPDVTYTAYNRNRNNELKSEQYTVLQAAGMSGWTEVVKMFIGTNFVTPGILEDTLKLALEHYDCPSDLIGLLLKQGLDLNDTMVGDCPLLHEVCQTHDTFFQPPLDAFFLHGGNIDIENADHRTILECAVKQARGAHIDSVRWLIRHGADVSRIRFSRLKRYVILSSADYCSEYYFSEIPLILLLAGMRVQYGAQRQLSNIEVAISTWLQDDTEETHDDGDISRTVEGMWGQLEEAEREELQRVQSNLKKSIRPQFWTRQMVDLQEFSVDSLNVYSWEEYQICSRHDWNTRQKYQDKLDQLHKVLEFLSQPQSLQWYCRRCIRENLVSLQPSVVKTLPIPSKLKRYILCHEI